MLISIIIIIIIITTTIYFWNVHFFHAKLGFDIPSYWIAPNISVHCYFLPQTKQDAIIFIHLSCYTRYGTQIFQNKIRKPTHLSNNIRSLQLSDCFDVLGNGPIVVTFPAKVLKFLQDAWTLNDGRDTVTRYTFVCIIVYAYVYIL